MNDITKKWVRVWGYFFCLSVWVFSAWNNHYSKSLFLQLSVITSLIHIALRHLLAIYLFWICLYRLILMQLDHNNHRVIKRLDLKYVDIWTLKMLTSRHTFLECCCPKKWPEPYLVYHILHSYLSPSMSTGTGIIIIISFMFVVVQLGLSIRFKHISLPRGYLNIHKNLRGLEKHYQMVFKPSYPQGFLLILRGRYVLLHIVDVLGNNSTI